MLGTFFYTYHIVIFFHSGMKAKCRTGKSEKNNVNELDKIEIGSGAWDNYIINFKNILV